MTLALKELKARSPEFLMVPDTIETEAAKPLAEVT
uniref:Uncharacterized protein n=1 Tax=Candidozyma auris TaxID=498019 RepID=A0A0L0NTD8_CANAR